MLEHRNPKLVYTNSIIPSNSDTDSDPELNQKIPKSKKRPRNQKLKDQRPKKKSKVTAPRRSKRLAQKQKSDSPDPEPKKKSKTDLSSDHSDDQSIDLEKESIKSSLDSDDLSDDLLEFRDEIMNDDIIFYQIYDKFADSDWFIELSEEDKFCYVERMRDLIKENDRMPSIKEIMDLNIDPIKIKTLINERLQIDKIDKFSPIYDHACRYFINRYHYILDNNDTESNLDSIENEIIKQTKYVSPLRNRILNSHYDQSIKSIIYDKYMMMLNSEGDDTPKYNRWIETALSIPSEPKKININPDLPQNEAISELITRMMHQLNQKIYGMQIAKEELICVIANMIINPKSKEKAIGLYGPPGIGKTMIADILAEVLELPIEKISFGGINGSSFLEGHEFTYIGAEPGCITKSIVKMGFTNGIIYLDELDKISKTEYGKEVEHALLHITDFTQNHNFRDKYLSEIPIDLSNYIFIYSMNQINEFDSALMSRIPVIKFDGYTVNEKIGIINNYVLPELIKNYGMNNGDIIISEPVIRYLINNIREEDEINGKSGVRGLKKILNRIIKRINLYRVASINGKLAIDLSFRIDDFKMPFEITMQLVKQVISNSSDFKKTEGYECFYI